VNWGGALSGSDFGSDELGDQKSKIEGGTFGRGGKVFFGGFLATIPTVGVGLKDAILSIW